MHGVRPNRVITRHPVRPTRSPLLSHEASRRVRACPAVLYSTTLHNTRRISDRTGHRVLRDGENSSGERPPQEHRLEARRHVPQSWMAPSVAVPLGSNHRRAPRLHAFLSPPRSSNGVLGPSRHWALCPRHDKKVAAFGPNLGPPRPRRERARTARAQTVHVPALFE